jgi:hypothetical protein
MEGRDARVDSIVFPMGQSPHFWLQPPPQELAVDRPSYLPQALLHSPLEGQPPDFATCFACPW